MSYKDEWKGYTVKELIDKSIIAKPLDGNHGNYHPKGNDFIENGIPFVMASDLQHGKINYNSCKFISKKQAKRLRKGFSINGDILITHKATIGRTAIVKNTPTDFIILTPQVTYYRVLNEEKLNRIFLKYYFDSVKFQDLIHSWAGGGSTRLYIGITAQLKLPIKFPSIRTQNRIASILSAFDEKIEVNRQMNATLEAMAQAMFREMCLPDDEESLEDGWEWKKIGDLVDTVSNTYKFKGIDEIIFLNTGDVSKGFVQHHDYRPTKGLPGQAKKRIQKDDILYSEIRPKNKRYAYVNFDAENYVVSTKLMVLRSKKIIDTMYIYFYLTQDNVIAKLQQLAESRSGTFPQITFTQLKDIDIPIPSDDVLNQFLSFLKPTYEKIYQNHQENLELAQSRDLLLPKLINGEIEV